MWIDVIMENDKKKKLHESLTATIQTKVGPTGKIHIKNSIRQSGGVLFVLEYALLMDEGNKEIHGTDHEATIPDINIKVAGILWMTK